MQVVFLSPGHDADEWIREIQPHVPDAVFHAEADITDPDRIDFAIIWHHSHGSLTRFRNLKAMLVLGAGVDHAVSDPDLPDVPLGRIVHDQLTAGMCEYVVLHVLRFFRELPRIEANQRERHWQYLAPPDASRTTVGILGLGAIGRQAAAKLQAFDFQVVGWSRSRKSVPGVESFAGQDELPDFLARSEYLVVLLPLTPDTRGIINAANLAHLPDGAYLINLARGGHVVDDDLLAALDSGRVAGAVLDVFNTEPLPEDHPYWQHPNVVVTPHNAGDSLPGPVAPQVAENIRRARDGLPPLHPVDRTAGY